jgi:hypothetical protein
MRGRGMRGRGIRAHLPAKGSSTHGCRADQRTAAALKTLNYSCTRTAQFRAHSTQSRAPPMADQRGTAEPGTEPDAVRLCRVALNVAFRAVAKIPVWPSKHVVRPRRRVRRPPRPCPAAGAVFSRVAAACRGLTCAPHRGGWRSKSQCSRG